MKATSNTNEPSRDDAVTRELLLLADRQEIQPPADVLDRVRARLHENAVQSPSAAPARTTASWTKRVWFAGAGAAAVVLITLLFSRQPSTIAWSQVAEAVRAVPWIHLKFRDDEGQSGEEWLSFSQNIVAIRCGHMVKFWGTQSGVLYEYDSRKKKLYRLPMSDGDAKEFESLGRLFQAICRGDGIVERAFSPQLRIVKQRQRTETEQGRRWILYELELQRTYDGLETPREMATTAVEIRVDPEKMLPDSMTEFVGEVKVEAAFDYPNEGPADIYALGVPRDAPIEDRTPPAELSRILKLIEQNRCNFGDYLAVSGDNSKEAMNVRIVQCKGEKLRVDMCGTEQYIQRNDKKERVGKSVRVASAADLRNWWREYGEEIKTSGVLQPLTRRDKYAGRYRVELLAYPPTLDLQQLASSLVTAHLDPKGQNGPAGSVRVGLLYASRGGPDDTDRVTFPFSKQEYWLQPKYGYAVVKQVISYSRKDDDHPLKKSQLIFEYDDFHQTPRGIWYPTVSRWKIASASQNKSKPSGFEFHDEVRYFYLDFTAELPDELFGPG